MATYHLRFSGQTPDGQPLKVIVPLSQIVLSQVDILPILLDRAAENSGVEVKWDIKHPDLLRNFFTEEEE